MTADEIKKALQPFGKVDTTFSGMKAGTGLGLTIVESLVKLHGGELQLISQKGAGTTARVVMPASRVLLDAKPATPDGDGRADDAAATETGGDGKADAAPEGDTAHLKVVK